MDRKVAKELMHIHGWLARADEIDREQTWLTLSVDLPAWHASLTPLIEQAEMTLESEAE